MKRIFLYLMVIAALFFAVSCGSGGDDSDSGDRNEVTSEELNKISNLLVSAMNDAEAGSSSDNVEGNVKSAQDNENMTATNAVKGYSYTSSQTCNNSNYDFTSAGSGSYNCPTSGHVTYSGNLRTYCSSWMHYTNPYEYCECQEDWYVQNQMTFQYSDPTNNLYDCDYDGLIIDGTIYFAATGAVDDMVISMTGTLGLHRRGSSGGLVMITDDCRINLYYADATQKWTGSICGHAVR